MSLLSNEKPKKRGDILTRCERRKFLAAVAEFKRQIPIRAAMASRVPFSELSDDVRQEILDYLNEKLFE